MSALSQPGQTRSLSASRRKSLHVFLGWSVFCFVFSLASPWPPWSGSLLSRLLYVRGLIVIIALGPLCWWGLTAIWNSRRAPAPRQPEQSLSAAPLRQEGGSEPPPHGALNTALLNAAPDGIIVLEGTGRVIEFNAKAEEMFGYRRADAIGQPLCQLIVPPRLRVAQGDDLHRCLEQSGAFSRQRIEMSAMRADGSELPIELTVSAGQYSMRLFIAYARDLTDAKRTESAQRRSEQRLAEAQRVAHLGSWEYDALTQEITWSDETFRLFGCQPEQNPPSYTHYLQRLSVRSARRGHPVGCAAICHRGRLGCPALGSSLPQRLV